ncbi:E3 ubiquitin-protein ligase RNF128 [Drosophila tropicalis]|uniref:E3 ubiquitin-protein ligase RNF128 n=1 Tax=Drosophila tropicalis TaxID=46794 RepID=UPI0035AB736C
MGDKCAFCTICSERYQAEDIIHATTCGHAFHEECLKRWREESTTCPICRRQVAQYFQLYLDFDDFSSPDQSQGQTSAISPSDSSSNSNRNTTNNNSSSSACNGNKPDEGGSDGANREFENLLYETGIYREELDYLNQRISTLMSINSDLEHILRLQSEESESE